MAQDQQTQGRGSRKSQSHVLEVRGNGISENRVAAYLPAQFKTIGTYEDHEGNLVVKVVGYDNAGWTFEDYVKPRLASRNMFASCKACDRQEAARKDSRIVVRYVEDEVHGL